MAIYDERQRALELEEEAKAGTRAAPRADQPPWKDVRREAAGIRRDIPANVQVLRNEPEVPQAFQSGTGASPNPYRPDTAATDPSSSPGKLGEPSTTVNRLGAAQNPEGIYREMARNAQQETETERQTRQERQRDPNSDEEYRAWREIHDRMTPEDQQRDDYLQGKLARRRGEIGRFVDNHPENFRIDENGDIQGSDVTPDLAQRMDRLFYRREMASRELERHQGRYVQGRPQGGMRDTSRR